MGGHRTTMAALRADLAVELEELNSEPPSPARDLVRVVFEAFSDFATGRADRPWADELAAAALGRFGDVMEAVVDGELAEGFGLCDAYARTADMLIGIEERIAGVNAAG